MNTAKPRKPTAPGRAWALTGFLLGSLTSIGFNLQAAWLPADKPETPDDWMPSIPSQIGAIVWPMALMVSVEVLARVAWPKGNSRLAAFGWGLVRVLGLILVAGGSGVISYSHIHDVLITWGYGDLGAAVGPLVIDGLMLISGFALVSIGRAARATVDTAQATTDVSPAEPAHTDPARRPQVPPRAGDEPHAVSPATPQSTPGETAPEPPAASPAPVARPARARMQTVVRPPARRTAGRTSGRPESPAPGDGLNDDQVIARLRAERAKTGDLPTESWMRKNLGVGQGRAARLRKEAAARPDLHTVNAEEVAV